MCRLGTFVAILSISFLCPPASFADDVPPEVTALAVELQRAGYSDFNLKTNLFGSKSLIAMKGNEETTVKLSRDFSVKSIETRSDTNGDGKYDKSEIVSKDRQNEIETNFKPVKEAYEKERSEIASAQLERTVEDKKRELSKNGNGKVGKSDSSNNKNGGSRSGDSKDSGNKGGGSKDGDGKNDGGKGGGNKGGDGKNGGGKGGDSKGGDSKGGGKP